MAAQGPGSPGSPDVLSVRAAVRRRPPQGCAAARPATSAQHPQPPMTLHFLMDHFFTEDSKFFLLAFNTLLHLTPPCLCNLFCPQHLTLSLVALFASLSIPHLS